MSVRFPAESAQYRAARDRLLQQEIELRRATEAVAVARRQLPPGGRVPQDYVFQGAGANGAPVGLKLSELFAPGKDSLVIYSFMFPRSPADQRPGPASGSTAVLPLADGLCPSCTALLDQLEGAADHIGQRVNLAVVARAPLARLLACSIFRKSAAGKVYACCPRWTTATTATTSAKPPTARRCRCSMCSTATAARSATSGARKCSTHRPIPARIRAMSARLSRCGTSSI